MNENWGSWFTVKGVVLMLALAVGAAIGAAGAALDDVETRWEQRAGEVVGQPSGDPVQALVRSGEAEIVTAVDDQAQVGDAVKVWFSLEDQRPWRAESAEAMPYLTTRARMLNGALLCALGALTYAVGEGITRLVLERRRPRRAAYAGLI